GRRPACAECVCRVRRVRGEADRRRAGARKLGDATPCLVCGSSFILTNPRQRYCGTCGPVVKREKAREASRRRQPPPKDKQREYWTRYGERHRQKVRQRALDYSKCPEVKARAAERARAKRK